VDSLAYFTLLNDGNFLVCVNVSNPVNPQLVAEYTATNITEGYIKDLEIDGDRAFLSESSEGIEVVNIADPTNMYQEAVINIIDYAGDIFVHDSLIYGLGGGFWILNISDIYSHSLVYGPVSGYGGNMFLDGNRLFVTGFGGVTQFDITDPVAPDSIGWCDLAGGNIFVNGNLVFHTSESYGLYVSDLNSGLVVGYYDTPYKAGKVAHQDGITYVVDQSAVIGFTASNSTAECGDANGDGVVNILDIIFLINYVYNEGPAPQPPLIGDLDYDGYVLILDITALINYLYAGGPEPTCGLQ
jgi:hypothetical protein